MLRRPIHDEVMGLPLTKAFSGRALNDGAPFA